MMASYPLLNDLQGIVGAVSPLPLRDRTAALPPTPPSALFVTGKLSAEIDGRKLAILLGLEPTGPPGVQRNEIAGRGAAQAAFHDRGAAFVAVERAESERQRQLPMQGTALS